MSQEISTVSSDLVKSNVTQNLHHNFMCVHVGFFINWQMQFWLACWFSWNCLLTPKLNANPPFKLPSSNWLQQICQFFCQFSMIFHSLACQWCAILCGSLSVMFLPICLPMCSPNWMVMWMVLQFPTHLPPWSTTSPPICISVVPPFRHQVVIPSIRLFISQLPTLSFPLNLSPRPFTWTWRSIDLLTWAVINVLTNPCQLVATKCHKALGLAEWVPGQEWRPFVPERPCEKKCNHKIFPLTWKSFLECGKGIRWWCGIPWSMWWSSIAIIILVRRTRETWDGIAASMIASSSSMTRTNLYRQNSTSVVALGESWMRLVLAPRMNRSGRHGLSHLMQNVGRPKWLYFSWRFFHPCCPRQHKPCPLCTRQHKHCLRFLWDKPTCHFR